MRLVSVLSSHIIIFLGTSISISALERCKKIAKKN